MLLLYYYATIKREFTATNSNDFILKPKPSFWWFYQLSKIYINFGTFSKQIQPHGLSISEIIQSEKRGYLNALQVLFEKIRRQSTF